jgi:antitoxin component YwqK of YwqJK toxin-antitoxin module
VKASKQTLAILMLVAVVAGCGQANSNYELLADKRVECPEGSHLRYEPWGESGLEAVCLLNHGRVVIAEYGHIVIEGQYDMGKKAGEWRWFDASGKIVRTERYDGTKP